MHLSSVVPGTKQLFRLQGVLLGSPATSDAASTLLWHAFDGWEPAGGQWELHLPDGEEAAAVAAGSTFLAAVTSSHTLRLFTHAGANCANCANCGSE